MINFILRFLSNIINNPRVIQELADSRPIRRAAQLTAYALFRGKNYAQKSLEDATKNIKVGDPGEKVQSFSRTFREELQKGLKEMNQKMKEK